MKSIPFIRKYGRAREKGSSVRAGTELPSFYGRMTEKLLKKGLEIHLPRLLQQKLIALLDGINLIGIAVDQIWIDDIFKVGVSRVQGIFGSMQVLK